MVTTWTDGNGTSALYPHSLGEKLSELRTSRSKRPC